MYSNNKFDMVLLDSEWENDDCDPNLACGDSYLLGRWFIISNYMWSENCDEPIGECDDSHDDIDSCEV